MPMDLNLVRCKIVGTEINMISGKESTQKILIDMINNVSTRR